MANKLIVAPAPHVQTAQSTTRIMRDVVIALMPALVVWTCCALRPFPWCRAW